MSSISRAPSGHYYLASLSLMLSRQHTFFFKQSGYSFSFTLAIFARDRTSGPKVQAPSIPGGYCAPAPPHRWWRWACDAWCPTARGRHALPHVQVVIWAFDGQDNLIVLTPGKTLNHRLPHLSNLGKLAKACLEFLCILWGSSQWLGLDLGGCLR